MLSSNVAEELDLGEREAFDLGAIVGCIKAQANHVRASSIGRRTHADTDPFPGVLGDVELDAV